MKINIVNAKVGDYGWMDERLLLFQAKNNLLIVMKPGKWIAGDPNEHMYLYVIFYPDIPLSMRRLLF